MYVCRRRMNNIVRESKSLSYKSTLMHQLHLQYFCAAWGCQVILFKKNRTGHRELETANVLRGEEWEGGISSRLDLGQHCSPVENENDFDVSYTPNRLR